MQLKNKEEAFLSIKNTGQLAAEGVIKSIEIAMKEHLDNQGNLSVNTGVNGKKITQRDLKLIGSFSNISQKSHLPSKHISDMSVGSNLSVDGDVSITDKMNEVGASNEIISASVSTIADMVANAGIWGAVIGGGIESVSQFKSYKEGRLSGRRYVEEIAKTGSQFGIKSSAISAVMLNVSTFISVGGSSIPITVPVVIALNYGLDQVLAPMFAKGKYKDILTSMKYYADTGEAYAEFITSVEQSKATFSEFVSKYSQQEDEYTGMKREEVLLNQKLNASLERLTKDS